MDRGDALRYLQARGGSGHLPQKRWTTIPATMQTKTLILLSLLVSAHGVAAPLQCEADALAQAKKLLAFHSDGNSQAAVASHAKALPALANPANKKQQFLVLEVMGYVYKANYRMRFLFYPLDGDCVLMGQEILELSSI